MEIHDTPIEQVRMQKTGRLQTFPWVLTLFWGVLLAFGVCLASIGITYGRYMTTGQVSVGFFPVAKPMVTVTSTRDNQSEFNTRVFQVTCNQSSTDAGIRVRLYASAVSEAPTITVTQSVTNITYILTARRLDANTMAGKEAMWVYIFTDDTGKEILFPSNYEMIDFTVCSESDISELAIHAEVVKK